MIIHVDMDAFYASVEIRDNPALASLPVVVGGSPQGRGVVSAASYEARKFGVHSAMSAGRALRLCPNLVIIKPRMEHYVAISHQLRAIFHRFTDRVEPLSLDEAFLDVTGSTKLFGSPESTAKQLKAAILAETGLTASAGVAPNKFLAKVASDLRKPNGLVVVAAESVQEFLDPLPIAKIWGIGKVTQKRFESMGVKTIRQLRDLPLASLQARFGVNSDHFYRLARGQDGRAVVPDREAKSISHETTFHADIDDADVLHAWMGELVDQVARRMRRHDIVGKTVHTKLRYSDFETITRNQSLAEPTHVTDQLQREAQTLLKANLQFVHRSIRLLGMGVSMLRQRTWTQLTLFDQAELERTKKIDAATDSIRDKFGHTALARGTTIQHQTQLRRDTRETGD